MILYYLYTPIPLNESPSEKEGKLALPPCGGVWTSPSMKVPPKRKGNLVILYYLYTPIPLNESPSEKEGKLALPPCGGVWTSPSMKVPPKRKGNEFPLNRPPDRFGPQ